jgi:hypothetical protein
MGDVAGTGRAEEAPGAGRAKLRMRRGFPRNPPLRRTPQSHRLRTDTRQLQDRRCESKGWRESCAALGESAVAEVMGVDVLGQDNGTTREAPVRRSLTLPEPVEGRERERGRARARGRVVGAIWKGEEVAS